MIVMNIIIGLLVILAITSVITTLFTIFIFLELRRMKPNESSVYNNDDNYNSGDNDDTGKRLREYLGL